MERETYLHLFSYCDHVRDLWLGLEEYMNKEFSIEPIQINEPNVIWKSVDSWTTKAYQNDVWLRNSISIVRGV